MDWQEAVRYGLIDQVLEQRSAAGGPAGAGSGAKTP